MRIPVTAAVLFAAVQAAVLPSPGLAIGLDTKTTDRMATDGIVVASTEPALEAPLRLASFMPGMDDRIGPPPGFDRDGPQRPPFDGPGCMPGPRGPGAMRHGMMPPPPPPFGPMLPGGEAKLAARLAAMETAIGIRSEQLDAWRDFTDALLAVLAPPEPPPAAEKGKPPAPFARAARLAADVAERGREAEALGRAVTALEAKLTADQLARAARFERPPMPPHARLPGPPPIDGGSASEPPADTGE